MSNIVAPTHPQDALMAKPSFSMMWQAFPDHTKYPTLRELHTFIGGGLAKNIDIPGFGANGNTCAVRISRALNYGNLPISAKLVKSLGIGTMTGADGKLYIFRVRELKTYLRSALGVTPIKVSKDFNNAFIGNQGIVAFEVRGWSDASGHVALWNGSVFREEHDDYRNLKDDPKTTQVEASTNAMMLWKL
jgi:hypothetical protein